MTARSIAPRLEFITWVWLWAICPSDDFSEELFLLPWGAKQRLFRGILRHLRAPVDLETLGMSEVLPMWLFNPLAIRIQLCSSSPSQRPNMCTALKGNLESAGVHFGF